MLPNDAATTTSAFASTSLSVASSAESSVRRSRRRLRSAPVGAAPVGEKTVACQLTLSGSRRNARRNSRSAWRSSWAQNANRTGPS